MLSHRRADPSAPSRTAALQSAKAYADKINAAGGNATLFVYEGCGHGFLNIGEEVRQAEGKGGRRSCWGSGAA